MVKERGYPGGPSLFRQRIAQMRPRKQPEAFLRLKTLPGEQSQVDWGDFGKITIGKASRKLMAFVMVLSWSRQIFLRFYYNQQMENFLRGHVAAFEQWQGIPKIILYDNLKSAVLEREGSVIRFHPTLLALSSHYRFEPRPVAVACGNEKGRVERAIRYIRDNFFAGRQWKNIDDLNRQADCWCQGVSADRRCPENQELTVKDAFGQEQPALLALPDDRFSTHEQVQVRARKTPYIRFDLNDYSIPHTHVQKTLTVSANLSHVRVLDGDTILTTHLRDFDKGQQIEQQAHIDALLEQTVTRGHLLKTTINLLIESLEAYGQAEFHCAIEEALKQQSPYPEGVRQVLERRRDEKQQPPPLAIAVPEKAQHYSVKRANLADYDHLQSTEVSSDE